jgi:hypothetical protein
MVSGAPNVLTWKRRQAKAKARARARANEKAI